MYDNQKIDKLDLILIKNFCSLKAHIRWMKKQGTYPEKVFADLLSDKGLVSPVCKELSKLNCRKVNHSDKKWSQKTQGDRSPKRISR